MVGPEALTLAGVTALGLGAKFNNPRDIVVDGQGTIVVSQVLQKLRTVATEYFVRHWRRIRQEPRETMQLLKQLPCDVNRPTVEFMESLVD